MNIDCDVYWCKEDNHDKIWGVIKISPGKAATFWGRRGKKLQTKEFNGSVWEINRLIDKKQNKGYTRIEHNHLDELYPEFESDLEQTAMWAMLKG